MLIFIQPRLYLLDYEKLAFFEIDENGDEVEVKTPSATSTSRLVVVNKNTAKGVKESIAEGFTIADYEDALNSLKPKVVEVKRIGSDLHNIYSFKNMKVALSAFDTKRWICNNGIETLAFGHWRTNCASSR